jgi:hypothetical protein
MYDTCGKSSSERMAKESQEVMEYVQDHVTNLIRALPASRSRSRTVAILNLENQMNNILWENNAMKIWSKT